MLADTSIIKVFHAARQDLEIFFRLMDGLPAPIADTQIAAMACGYGDQIGYEPLMRSLLNAEIDKGSRFTDWSRRPLSSSQLAYALSDVTHLRDAYPLLTRQLEERGRANWVAEEVDTLCDPSLYATEPENAWRRMKLRGIKPNAIGPIMKLAEWREREAQERDVPRARVLKDDAIFEIARLQPASPEALSRARSAPAGFERSKAGAAILQAVADGKAIPRNALPKINAERRRVNAPADVVELLKVLLKRQCDSFDVAPKLIASSADIEEIAASDDADVPALRGWRRDVFGDAALKLKRGEIAFALEKGRVRLIDLQSPNDSD